MALYKRGEVWHYDFIHESERHRGTTKKRVKSEAAAALRAIRRQVEDGALGGGPGDREVTLGDVARKWYESRIRGKKSAQTVAFRLKTLFRHIDRDMPVSAIGPAAIEDALISRRLEPIRQSPKNGEPRFPTNSTVNRDIIDTTLRPILAYAADNMELPVRRIKWGSLRLDEPKERARAFTAGELAAWRDNLPEWHRPLFDFIANYGVRLREAFFPPSAYDNGEITLANTKNGLDHVIPLDKDDVEDMAARAAKARLARLNTVWFREDGGKLYPIHWRAFQSASKAALRAAGIEDARPVHDLRHHAATELLRATGNIKHVQALLNHQDIKSSARYAHTNKADLKAALRRVRVTKSTTKRGSRAKSAVEST